MAIKFIEFGKYVRAVDQRNDFYAETKDVKISWSSIGSVSLDKAEEFAGNLAKAIEFAKSNASGSEATAPNHI